MRSSTGQHWIALDHVRALAAFAVFTWHFTHALDGYPVTFAGAPALFPLAILDEGHTGVALFMTLSGYLFAKLLAGREVSYPLFFWNRLVRLAPLMIVAVLIADLVIWLETGQVAVAASFATVIGGFVLPQAPLERGLWSIVVEAHFYLALPLLMIAARRSSWALPLCVATAIAARLTILEVEGSVRFVAYWTIGGRIDQFLLGMIAFRHRDLLRGRHAAAFATLLAFAAFYWWFDAAGGWKGDGGGEPLWVAMPTIEGSAYALLIAWYDASFRPRSHGLSGLIGRAGAYSYSIYLLHFFVVFAVARFIDRHVMNLSNFYVACAWSLLCFAAMIPVGRLCFETIEKPFLRLRRDYTHAPPARRPLPIEARPTCKDERAKLIVRSR